MSSVQDLIIVGFRYWGLYNQTVINLVVINIRPHTIKGSDYTNPNPENIGDINKHCSD